MRSTREVLASIEIDSVEVACRFADLLVVEREDGSTDWECVLLTEAGPAIELAPVHVRLTGHDDRCRVGDAIVVRSDGTSHVLRGVGPLTTDGDPA